MKNTIIAILILAGISIFILQPSPSIKASTSDIRVAAQLSGTGSTTATVKATDEVNGTVYTLTHVGSGYYISGPVLPEYYTINACAITTHGSVTHVNFNTAGYITMQNEPCESGGD